LFKPSVCNAGGGGGKKPEIILIREEDIDRATFPERDVDGVTITTDISLKAWVLNFINTYKSDLALFYFYAINLKFIKHGDRNF
jgi:hypothetical protein